MINDSPYLEHILEAIEKIESYLKQTSYEDFDINTKVIWDTCSTNLPELKEKIIPIVAAEKEK